MDKENPNTRTRETDLKAQSVLLNERSLTELMPWSDKPEVIARAFTLYTKVPGFILDGYPLGNPESFVRFVEKSPEEAQKIVDAAKDQGVLG